MHLCKCRCELVHDTGIEQSMDKITKLIADLVIMICNVNLHILHDAGTDICVIEMLTPADSTRKFSVA